MSLFPVSYSLLSKQAVGLHIQHHYEIGSVVKIIRSLSENDLAAVPFFVAIRQLWLFGLCFQDSEFAGMADFDEGFIDSKMQYFKSLGYV